MKKSIILVIAGLMLGFMASAQSQQKIEKDFEGFSTVKVEDNFVVKLKNSEKYSVSINVDERIAAHVQAYEKGGTLYLILDEKGYSKELKKELRQKGAAKPVLEAEICMPSLGSLVMKDDVVLVHCDEFHTDKFTFTAADDVKVSQLKVVCRTAVMDLSSDVEMSADMQVSDKLYLKASKSSKLSLSQNGGKAELELSGSSYLDMRATVDDMIINASASAESHISGTASGIDVNTSGYSRTDVEQFEVKEGNIVMTGSSKCHVNITDEMKVNLTGGSMLTFKSDPYIEIDRIVSSTLIKHDDPKRK